jgi:uncharacterized protein (TIGR03435 family)
MKLTLISALALGVLGAQSLSYDVATIKSIKGPVNMSRGPLLQGRTVTCTALTVRDLITYAYNIRYEQLAGGPNWIGEDHYDLLAKSEGEGPLKPSESRQMMQALLAERFKLQVHRETQEVPMYALVVGKRGPKVKASEETTACFSVRGSDKGMSMEARCATMELLTMQLSGTAGRHVVDRTGLTGRYAFKLEWWPVQMTPPADNTVPSMFDALQEQLGLKLEPTKGPLEKVIVDHADRPTEN